MTAAAPLPTEPEDDLGRRILDAAVDRFGTFGIRRTTMEDVATAAGIGRATLYRRFAGRQDLVRVTVEREMARFITAVEAEVHGVHQPEERFVAGFVAMIRIVREHPLLARLLQIEPADVLPILTLEAGPVLAMCRDWLATELAVARRRGRIRADVDVRVVAELLVRLSHSLLLTPDGVIAADDEAGLRDLASRYLAPALFMPAPLRPERPGPA